MSAPFHPLAGTSAPFATHAIPAALTADNQSMDVDLSVTQLAAANATNIELLKLSTSSPSSDIPHDGILRNPQELAATYCFPIILDEKLAKIRGIHIKRRHLPSNLPDSVAHARYKTFLTKHPMIEHELISGVRATTRFASYQGWRAALLADFDDGSRLRQLVLDYRKTLTVKPLQKHMADNNLDLSNKIAGAFNLLPQIESSLQRIDCRRCGCSSHG
jgi:hypothetical protein